MYAAGDARSHRRAGVTQPGEASRQHVAEGGSTEDAGLGRGVAPVRVGGRAGWRGAADCAVPPSSASRTVEHRSCGPLVHTVSRGAAR